MKIRNTKLWNKIFPRYSEMPWEKRDELNEWVDAIELAITIPLAILAVCLLLISVPVVFSPFPLIWRIVAGLYLIIAWVLFCKVSLVVNR